MSVPKRAALRVNPVLVNNYVNSTMSGNIDYLYKINNLKILKSIFINSIKNNHIEIFNALIGKFEEKNAVETALQTENLYMLDILLANNYTILQNPYIFCGNNINIFKILYKYNIPCYLCTIKNLVNYGHGNFLFAVAKEFSDEPLILELLKLGVNWGTPTDVQYVMNYYITTEKLYNI